MSPSACVRPPAARPCPPTPPTRSSSPTSTASFTSRERAPASSRTRTATPTSSSCWKPVVRSVRKTSPSPSRSTRCPPTIPARQAERQSAHHDATDNDHAAADSDDSTDDEDRSDRRDRDDGSRDEDETEAPAQVDAPHPSDGWSADEVNAAALARARRLEISLVPSATETAKTHSFRLRDDQPGFLFVRVAKDVPAPGGYKLRGDYTAVVGVPIPDKEIVIQGDGGLLALSGERKLSVLSRGLPAIKYEIARVPAAAINHLVSQTRGDFQNPRNFATIIFPSRTSPASATKRNASPGPTRSRPTTPRSTSLPTSSPPPTRAWTARAFFS